MLLTHFIAPIAHTLLFCVVYIRMTEGGFEIPFLLCKDSEMDRQTREKYIMERVHEWKPLVDSLDFLLSCPSYFSQARILCLKISRFYTASQCLCCVASRRTAEKMSLDISFHVITFECFILVFLFRLLKSFRLCLIHWLDFSCCFAHKRPTNVQRSIQFNWPRFWIGYHSCDLTFRQDAALSSSSSYFFLLSLLLVASYGNYPCGKWRDLSLDSWFRPLRYCVLNLTFCRGPFLSPFSYNTLL
jgi:hypothetical protein